MHAMDNEASGSDETRIRALIDAFSNAFRARDIEGVMSIFDPGIVSFDLAPPLQCVGSGALRRHWEATFASFQGPVGYDVHDLRIAVAGDLAFSHSLNRTSATLASGRSTRRWLRWTACWRKTDGTWRVTHEHVSVPVDPSTARRCRTWTPATPGRA